LWNSVEYFTVRQNYILKSLPKIIPWRRAYRSFNPVNTHEVEEILAYADNIVDLSEDNR
jgi:hypothetical protein